MQEALIDRAVDLDARRQEFNALGRVDVADCIYLAAIAQLRDGLEVMRECSCPSAVVASRSIKVILASIGT